MAEGATRSEEEEHRWVIEMEKKLRDMELEDLLPQRQRLYEFYESDKYRQAYSFFFPCKVSLIRDDSKRGIQVKEESLLHFLRRSKLSDPLKSYLKALREAVGELRDAYDGLGHRLGDDDDEDVRNMLLDGSFLVEFIRTKKDRRSGSRDVNRVILRILDDHAEMKLYKEDILMMGNQVPIMLLETLLMVGTESSWTTRFQNEGDRISFLKDIAATFIPTNRVPKIEGIYNEFESSLHILDVYRRCLVHHNFKRGKNPPKRNSQEEFYSMNIPSATELNKVGIGFTTSGSTSILDVSLLGDTLMLPVIVIDDSIFSLFYNIITFEHLHKDVAKNEVASYIYFMGCLVQVADDASLLQSRGIIVATSPPGEVAGFFNRITREFSLDHDDPIAPEFIEVSTMVRTRYNKMSNEWRKDLFQTYLKSPWAVMSLMAGLLLLILSIIQTTYTVLSYVRPK